MEEKKKIARWETLKKKYWYELYLHSDGCYTYSGSQRGGCLGCVSEEYAVAEMKRKMERDGFRYYSRPV